VVKSKLDNIIWMATKAFVTLLRRDEQTVAGKSTVEGWLSVRYFRYVVRL